MQNDIEQRTVNLQATVVLDETQLPEPVHGKANSRSGGANDFRQCLLADLCNHRLWFAFFAEIGQQQKHPRQPLLTGIEELIHQILLNPNVPGEHVMEQQLRKGRLFVEQMYHTCLFQPHD